MLKNVKIWSLALFLIFGYNHLSFAQETKKQAVYYSPGGTYSDWYFAPSAGYESLEWTFVPVADPAESLAKQGLLHYYAYNFGLVNASSGKGGGYAGFQSNGIFMHKQQGKVINFSIWGSNGGKSQGMINPGNEESSGYQIMYKFNWVVGHPYRFQLKEGPSKTDDKGKWWGLWVTDQTTKITTFIGEQRVSATINGKPTVLWASHTSMFGEDLHWWNSLNGRVKYNDPKAFEPSAMAALNITANNGKVKPTHFKYHHNSGKLVTSNNGFKTVGAPVTIYADSLNMAVQHNLGTWPNAAPNYLQKNKKASKP